MKRVSLATTFMGAPFAKSSLADPAGSCVGRYVIEKELGRGAMGIVYKAYDPVIERSVAIKRLKLDFETDEFAAFRERFVLEAKSAGRLNHPNIVTIYDVGEVEGITYIAMEYLEGLDLKHIIAESSPYTFRQIAEIVLHVCDALAYAHSQGVIHRDIKPANIMIVRDWVPKVLDFGLARLPAGARDQAGSLIGSPRYMSPEQIENKSLDGRSDVYALGTVLYEMLAGRAPFNADTLESVIYQVLHEMPAPPQIYSRNTPHFLAKIVAKALAKNPDERYQNAAAMAEDLRRYTMKAQAKATMGRKKTSADAVPNLLPLSVQGARSDATALSNTVFLEPPAPAVKTAAAPPQPWPSGGTLLLAGVGLLTVILLAVGVVTSHRKTPQATAIANPAAGVAMAGAPGESEASGTASSGGPMADDGPGSGKPANDGSANAPTNGEARTNASTKTKRNPARKDVVAATTAPKGTIHLAISPWGEIFVDGSRAGISPPLTQLQLPAGRHRIEVRNAGAEPYKTEIEVDPAQARKIKFKFE
jgi:serine/threonine-protein kinase